MVNAIVLIVKYYIYAQKCKGKSLCFMEVIGKIAKYKAIERKISIRTNTVEKHDKK